jgi:hypothetical protein
MTKRNRMARAKPVRAQELIDIAAAGIANEIISEVLGADCLPPGLAVTDGVRAGAWPYSKGWPSLRT